MHSINRRASTVKRLAGALSFWLAATAVPAVAIAQVGTTTEIIAGRVRGPDSLPIAGATVDVTSVENGVVKHTRTRADGRFSLLFRDGGAQYRLTVKYLGMAPASLTLTRQADEDRLIAEIRLAKTAVTLSAVQVTAQAQRPGAPPASTAGGTERVLSQQFLVRFPVSPGDLNSIAALAPGVVQIAGTDSGPASFSVGAQPANQNNVTVDGSSFLFGTLPQNSVRSVRVVTNAYDVSRGQFTGGQVATTTLSGTSVTQGTATVSAQQPSLEFPTSALPTFGQRYTQNTGSFGIGGPIAKDEAFYFASMQYDRRTDAVASLLDANGPTLANLGVSGDSLSRFLQLLGRKGVSPRAGAPSERLGTTLSTLGRIDWDFSDSHSLMIRGDYRHADQNATRIGTLSLPATGGMVSSDGGGLMASVTSNLGAFINEFRGYASSDQQSTNGFLASPLGVVTVTSDLTGGKSGLALLQFGGNPSLPRHTTTRLFELSNELSWLAGDAHRIKFGALLNANRSTISGVGNQFGTFIYNSLADFDAGRPALFARSLSGADQRSGTNNAALYIGDAYRQSQSLQVVYGARMEATRLPDAPSLNPLLQQTFGRRTDAWPTDVRVTPRVGFTYLLGNVAGIPAGVFKGGAGLFRGTVPLPLVGAVASATGLAGAQSNVLCAGSAVPTPNWQSFADDPATIPTSCAGGSTQPSLSSTRPSVYLFDSSFGAPEVWRGSLGWQRRIASRWAIGVDALHSYGERSAYATDLNLPAQGFVLSSEGNRPVLGQPGDIVPATGTATGNGNRPNVAFGPVISVASGFHSQATQLAFTLSGPALRGGGTSITYTYNRATDQSNGFGLGASAATTAGNPNVAEWGTSDLERRHQVVAQSISQFPHGLEFTVIGRLLSGPRYTPMVSGDVNGDGARNDRAFIPLTSGTAPITMDMARLLATTDSRAAECLRDQEGQLAQRNSCTTPWTPQLDLQVNWTPRAIRLDERLTLSLVATNTLAGADRLLHGNDLHGWGQPIIPDRNLVSVTGFDPNARQFAYKVNQHFGTPSGADNAFGVPFQLMLRGQVILGVDPVKAQIRAVTGGTGGNAASLKEVRDRILKGVPYPVQRILDGADSLKLDLTTAQRATLTAIATRYTTFVDSIGDAVAVLLSANGGRPDLGAMAPKLQQVNISIVKELQQSIKDAEAAITPAQWAKVPDRIKFPLGQPAPPPRP
jgi:hypothetical protein